MTDHLHHHDHDHTHHHVANYDRAFAVGISLNILFVLVEAYFGWQADSLALLSDAGHNLSDVLGLLMAWGGFYLARLRPNQRHTYGLGRATMMAAMFNALLLLIVVGSIVLEAIDRFAQPVPIQGGTVMLVAAIGVVINGLTAWLFMSGNQHDINLRGAFLHMAADALVSLSVIVAGAAFILTGWTWVDPAISLVIALVILLGTWGLLRHALHLSLDGVPASIELGSVRNYLSALDGVTEIHDLHVWAMSTSEIALTVHLIMPDGHPGDDFLCNIAQALHHDFAIAHTTIQVETGDQPCILSGHPH
ncbi:cobalt transporter [Ferrigenium kumadai]|uniref:Cobalt transporter n=1 Tax=Ferrigenium kumadai TaxID=1682490 RepID=A0AAN1T0S2_9PROT|nr:cation diffusion facilitator family transporter [Ferrigenium kumadai]BBI99750.1 cobalt transporter [Ferrigenium kumadai]